MGIQTDHPLLQEAIAAVERNDLRRADALFLEHLAQARNDPDGLAKYGVFCLRTSRAHAACYLLDKANALHPGRSEWLTQAGDARLELKEFEAAQRSFEAAISCMPGNAQANYGLGLCHEHAAAWPEAITAFAGAMSAPVDALPVLLHLADCCHRAGEHTQARLHYESAQRLASAHPALLLAFGTFLREQGEPAQAMGLIDRCGASHPNEPGIVLETARCLRALGDTTHALRWLDKLEKLSPGKPETSAEYGDCLADGGNLALAEPHWMRAIDLWIATNELAAAESLIARMLKINPNSASSWNARGGLEKKKHDLVAAEAAWRTALDQQPGRLDATASLALLYESTNRVAEAKALAERSAKSIGGGRGQYGAIELLFVLGKTLRRTNDLAGALRVLDQIDTLAPNPTQRMAASMERGKLLDLLDDTSGAMTAFAAGNAIACERWLRDNPGRNRFLAGIDFMLEVMRSDWMRQWKCAEGLQDHPGVAFLFGFPRSGTTLLNQVFDGHPAIQAIEEKPSASNITAGLRAMPGGYPHALVDLDAFDVAWLREAYFRSAAEHGAPDRTKLLLDKFPMNSVIAGMLYSVFPRARFVFALRHPCDVVLSCFMQNFEMNSTMANFCTLADTVALYTRTMDLWQAWRDALPLDVHTIRYEDVVDDFDDQIHALCDFLQVPWEDGLRQFSTRALDRGRINTPSYEQVSKPIYREARYRWERYREHLAPFLPALQPYIERFGYSDSTQPN